MIRRIIAILRSELNFAATPNLYGGRVSNRLAACTSRGSLLNSMLRFANPCDGTVTTASRLEFEGCEGECARLKRRGLGTGRGSVETEQEPREKSASDYGNTVLARLQAIVPVFSFGIY